MGKTTLRNSLLHNYFGFNRQQRNGLLVLLAISFVLMMLRLIYPYFLSEDEVIIKDLPLFEQEPGKSGNAAIQSTRNKQEPKNLFVFDPNTVSFEKLIQLGFKEKTAQALINFRNKGFVFKQKEDLKKVYGVSEQQYLKLEPYILLAQKKSTSEIKPEQKITQSPKETPEKLDLNSCDSAHLISIKGIGPVYAKRILKYRSMLGGYSNLEQLKEVYGFTEALYNDLKTSFNLNPDLIKKLNLNTDDFKTINKHPYLSYEVTASIFNLRRKTSITPSNLKELLHDDVLYAKLLPYLVFNP